MMRNKTRKGMTLIEIVISIAIAGVLALLMVEIMNIVNATMHTTTYLNKQLAHESKYADNQMTHDEFVHEFHNEGVVVTISEDGGAFGPLTASGIEYTASYLPKGEGVVDDSPSEQLRRRVEKTNYRFMSFEKTAPEVDEAAKVFRVKLIISGSTQIDQITSITIWDAYDYKMIGETDEDIIAAGVLPEQHISLAEMSFPRTPGTLLLEIPVPAINHNYITVQVNKDFVTDRGKTVTDHKWSQATLTYSTEATSPGGAKTYFKEVWYGFNGNSWKPGNTKNDAMS